jgi:hypothetical protein
VPELTNSVATEEDPGLRLAIDAFIWGYPRMLYDRYWKEFRQSGAALNQLVVMNRLATPDHGGVNVDTLYGVGWLELSDGPVVIDLPDANDRYYSLQLVDVYANNFTYLGRRLTGAGAQQHLLVPPGWQGGGPKGMPVIRSPSRRVFAFLRTLIDDEADLDHANAFNGGIRIGPLAAYPDDLNPSRLMNDVGPHFPHAHNYLERLGVSYFDILGDALQEDPPTRAEDIREMERYAALGIGPGRHPASDNPGQSALFEKAVDRGTEEIFAYTTNEVIGGWSTNLNFDGAHLDNLTKAANNRMGIGILGAEEAIYLMSAPVNPSPGFTMPSWTSLGPDGNPLVGTRKYRLYFPPGQLPAVDAFWSLTMYTKTMMLVRNPIDRYAIGDRTKGLQYGEDGSLEIQIQRDEPVSGTSNWLPAPDGEFQIWIRGYQPRPEFLNGSYRLPAVEIVE